ncbi:MAG: YchJ family protein [Opitutaceae bacterium]|nr:YchJ family protein [Opitutaceae bacterium]
MTNQPAGLAPPQPDSPCPCGSGQTFAACCEPIIAGQRPAANAELLMRSRFTAHAIRHARHLHRTYLSTAHLPYVEEPETSSPVVWTRLVIHAHDAGPNPDTAYVDFSAYYQAEGGEQVMHEKSEFKQVNGTWYFVRPVRQGPAPVKSTHPKVGRNSPCPCGSGKKYKHCCLAKA